MTKSPFSGPDEPWVASVKCDGCGLYYEELSALVWGRKNGLLRRLLCINCDPSSEKKVPYTVTQEGAEGR